MEMLLELIKDRVERTQGMAEDAMMGVGRRRCRVRANVVGALIVRDRQLTALGIVCPICVRQRKRAPNQAGEQ